MADPLQLLREFTISKRPVLLEGDALVFGDMRFPRSTETSFRSLKGAGARYTLEACWFMLQHQDTKFADYLVECSKHRFPKVSLVDRKELVSYLTGKIDSSPYISLISPALISTTPAPIPSSLASSYLAPFPHQPPHDAGAPAYSPFGAEGKRTAGDAQLDSHHLQQQQHESLGSVAKKARLEPQDIELDDRLKESKRLVAHRLEQPKGVKAASSASSAASATTTDALPAGLSKEQMEALRLKRRKKKLTSIQSEDIPERISSTRDKPSYVEADALVTADIINRERQLRTRISVLHSDTKRFTDIIGFMQQYQEREKKKKKEQQQKQAEEQVRSSGYNRYDINEKQLWRTKLKGTAAEDWDIDTRGTFAGLSGLQSISSALTSAPSSATTSSSSSGDRQPRERRLRPTDLIPIIIVPASLTSLLTLYNVKEFLEDGLFVPSVDKKNQGARKENLVVVKRKKGKDDSTVVPYHVIDNPSKFGATEWNRVVAVFALGPPWQFKDWKWSSPVELFSKTQGFYLHFDDSQVSREKHKRHLDRTAVLQFWAAVDKFAAAKKSNLKY
ncbi:uncharacterized protein ACA1_234280 [Acanthamoeba castellanii str. Neff]|uniref:Uncharacterized protein n=1 Tax=Acanthamoeba castellanii (strain ATCC 30010 / Neff) TaxID=1257118 RepID=L8H154_ACACF|nr:uncharacterized protein ACA1_234280 [Acanthamoeba castellanii str. Neff]ELR18990.1 hypothetical protein ACA1_234280 [Acanthamoeba castellanii str. Neff]